MATKLEDMLEMRIKGLALSLCCASCLVLPPRLRMGLVVGSGLGHLTSRVLALRTEWAETLPELGHAALRRYLHRGRMLAEVAALRRLVINQCGRMVHPVA